MEDRKVVVIMVDEGIIYKLKEFLENEARSGSMDFGCITPLYVYRMFGGQYSLEDIDNGLTILRKQEIFNMR